MSWEVNDILLYELVQLGCVEWLIVRFGRNEWVGTTLERTRLGPTVMDGILDERLQLCRIRERGRSFPSPETLTY